LQCVHTSSDSNPAFGASSHSDFFCKGEGQFVHLRVCHTCAVSDVAIPQIDIPRIWFRSCHPQVAKSFSCLLSSFKSQQNLLSEKDSIQKQLGFSDLIQRYPLSAVKLWSESEELLAQHAPFNIEQARKLLQDAPIIQSLQHEIERQAHSLNEVLESACDCSKWMIDDIFGSDAISAKAFITSFEPGTVSSEDVEHVCNIISDSFQACGALLVHAAAAAVDRHNNNIEYVHQSESATKMMSELKVIRLELAKKAEEIVSRDSEIEFLHQKLETLAAQIAANQFSQTELQNVMFENEALRDRILKLEMKLMEQPSTANRQHQETSQQIECLVYIAKVDFKGDGPNQLPLKKDDRIAVILEDDLGWARGICNGRLGLFPSIICEKTLQVEIVNIGSDHAYSLDGMLTRSLLKESC
jgi:hypothetical protein